MKAEIKIYKKIEDWVKCETGRANKQKQYTPAEKQNRKSRK